MSVPTEIPALGKIAGLSRKEAIYDTEVLSNTIGTQITQFTNFTAFANSPTNVLTKAFGRDTNLTGGQGGLPQAHRHMWYKWRCKVRTLDANLAAAGNVAVFEAIRRYRQLSFATFQLAQTRYITCQLDELLGWTESEMVSSSLASYLAIVPNVGPSLGRDVTVAGEPKVLEPLEQFQVITGTPSSGSIVVLSTNGSNANFYVTHVLDGVLTRGIVG